MDFILKTLYDYDANMLYQAFYIKGDKMIEAYSLDMDVIKEIYQCDYYRTVDIYEESLTKEDIAKLFADEEDFSYILDYTDLKIGDVVFLHHGEHKVTEVKEDFRESGVYETTLWNSTLKTQSFQFLNGHQTLFFKVENDDTWYAWEDYNYQQSDLYKYHKKVKAC